MPNINRRQFLEQLTATEAEAISGTAHRDPIFEKYANKELPIASKKTASLAAYTGSWGATQARHLLRRSVFGVRYEDVADLEGMTMSEAVDLLLNNPPNVPPEPVNDYSAIGDGDFTGVATGTSWVHAPYGSGTLDVDRIYSLKAWWMNVMINQNLSITEKMVFFWHNHFVTQSLVVLDARFSYVHNALLRTNALGNFRDLVKAVTKDSAMLRYLNGYENTKNLPDENYARELQELFTVGKDYAQNYNEDDVKAAARVLTGWNVNLSSLNSFFVSGLHDTGDKQFSAFYDNAIISGKTGAAGAEETDELIEMLFTKHETAHFICTKLYRFFVYYNIDANIDENIIQPMANLLVNSNFEIKPVLEKLLKSDHFYQHESMGCFIKTPLDILIGVLRSFNTSIPSAADVTEQFKLRNFLRNYGVRLGLNLADPPNVAGYPAFYESPAYYELWINSSTLPYRMEFTDLLVNSGFDSGTKFAVKIDLFSYVQRLPNPGNPTQLVQDAVDHLLGISVSEMELAALKSILLSGQASDHYWTDAWNAYLATPDDINKGTVENRLKAFFTNLLRLPEFQLC